MEHTKVAYTMSDISELKRPDLTRLAKKLGINNLKGKNEDLIDRIISTSEQVNCEYDEDGELALIGEPIKRVRKHPVLGEYVKVIVTPRDPEIKEETFANNDYQCRVIMGQEVEMPEGFMKFINTACYSVEHFYDENKYNAETGKYGMHTSRRVPDYFCSRVG